MVTCMDESIGYIVDAMKERGLWDNTITLFTTGKITYFKF
jgi:arylsulfatase A-like enzyme